MNPAILCFARKYLVTASTIPSHDEVIRNDEMRTITTTTSTIASENTSFKQQQQQPPLSHQQQLHPGIQNVDFLLNIDTAKDMNIVLNETASESINNSNNNNNNKENVEHDDDGLILRGKSLLLKENDVKIEKCDLDIITNKHINDNQSIFINKEKISNGIKRNDRVNNTKLTENSQDNSDNKKLTVLNIPNQNEEKMIKNNHALIHNEKEQEEAENFEQSISTFRIYKRKDVCGTGDDAGLFNVFMEENNYLDKVYTCPDKGMEVKHAHAPVLPSQNSNNNSDDYCKANQAILPLRSPDKPDRDLDLTIDRKTTTITIFPKPHNFHILQIPSRLSIIKPIKPKRKLSINQMNAKKSHPKTVLKIPNYRASTTTACLCNSMKLNSNNNNVPSLKFSKIDMAVYRKKMKRKEHNKKINNWHRCLNKKLKVIIQSGNFDSSDEDETEMDADLWIKSGPPLKFQWNEKKQAFLRNFNLLSFMEKNSVDIDKMEKRQHYYNHPLKLHLKLNKLEKKIFSLPIPCLSPSVLNQNVDFSVKSHFFYGLGLRWINESTRNEMTKAWNCILKDRIKRRSDSLTEYYLTISRNEETIEQQKQLMKISETKRTEEINRIHTLLNIPKINKIERTNDIEINNIENSAEEKQVVSSNDHNNNGQIKQWPGILEITKLYHKYSKEQNQEIVELRKRECQMKETIVKHQQHFRSLELKIRELFKKEHEMNRTMKVIELHFDRLTNIVNVFR